MEYRTFILLKPDALRRNLVNKIIRVFRKANFEIDTFDLVKPPIETFFIHYQEKITELGLPFKEKIIKSFSDTQVIPIILRSNDKDIIAKVRSLLGHWDPERARQVGGFTIRGTYGEDSARKADCENRFCENLVHASDSEESFIREASLWFPEGF